MDSLSKILSPIVFFVWVVLLVLNFLDHDLGASVWYGVLVLNCFYFLFFALYQNMVGYILKRLMGSLLTIWVIASVTFLLLRVLPGGPFDSEKALPDEVKAAIEAKYHLNDPLPKQYLTYLKGLLHGDLGESYKYLGRSITDIVKESFPASIQLGVFSLVLAYLLGIPIGVIAARFHNRWVDHILMAFAIGSVSVPSFLVAPILILVFCFWLQWLEPALWQGPSYYILPTLVLGTRSAAVIARLTRASVLEVIRSDFIRTGRAKGLSETKILFKHVLRNSLIPVLTFSGPLVAGIITGSFVVEQIFAIPGIGKHMVLSVSNRDYPLILGTTLLFSVLLVACNLIVDLLYAVVDPRIKVP
ncbi:MAG: ABC transporter permease [Bdellovibrionales bacterium]|nr:ABC transporter permease [Bdellovibrionales bacterium]